MIIDTKQLLLLENITNQFHDQERNLYFTISVNKNQSIHRYNMLCSKLYLDEIILELLKLRKEKNVIDRTILLNSSWQIN